MNIRYPIYEGVYRILTQHVVLHITSLVITFHRRGDSTRTKKGKNGRKRAEQGTGRHRETEAGKGDEVEKRKPVLCRVESELLLSPLPCIFHKTGG